MLACTCDKRDWFMLQGCGLTCNSSNSCSTCSLSAGSTNVLPTQEDSVPQSQNSCEKQQKPALWIHKGG
jgi:hypothetical protein